MEDFLSTTILIEQINMKKLIKENYCIEIQFEKGSKDPSRIFRAMQEMIDTFNDFDKSLIKTIDSNIEPILILEDIESGSIRSWLSSLLGAVDDDALKNIDWKPAVGKYLVKAKYKAVEFLNDKTNITDVSEIAVLKDSIHKLAIETDVKWLPIYEKISTRELLNSVGKISSSLSNLQETDYASYLISETEKVNFNLDFKINSETIDDLVTKDKIVLESEMILKVKKPDYLGESKWDFRHGGKSFSAKIIHHEWLESFQNRRVDIRPGDSVRAKVENINKYDIDGELISTEYTILKVIEVIQVNPPKQINMFD